MAKFKKFEVIAIKVFKLLSEVALILEFKPKAAVQHFQGLVLKLLKQVFSRRLVRVWVVS